MKIVHVPLDQYPAIVKVVDDLSNTAKCHSAPPSVLFNFAVEHANTELHFIGNVFVYSTQLVVEPVEYHWG